MSFFSPCVAADIMRAWELNLLVCNYEIENIFRVSIQLHGIETRVEVWEGECFHAISSSPKLPRVFSYRSKRV